MRPPFWRKLVRFSQADLPPAPTPEIQHAAAESDSITIEQEYAGGAATSAPEPPHTEPAPAEPAPVEPPATAALSDLENAPAAPPEPAPAATTPAATTSAPSAAPIAFAPAEAAVPLDQYISYDAQPANQLLPAQAYLAPDDLAVTAVPLRILAVGSCFLNSLMQPRVNRADSVTIDLVLATQIHEFPAAPPAPIGDYDCQVVQIPLRVIMGDGMFAALAYDDVAGHQAAFEKCCTILRPHLERRMTWNVEFGIPTFVQNFMVPQFPGAGRMFARYDWRNIEYFVGQLNEELERLLADYRNAYLLDVDRIAASFGRRYVQDDILTAFNHNALTGGEYIGDRIEPVGPMRDYYDIAPGRAFREAVLAEIRAMHRTLNQIDSVKLVVVDLDDTLWRGVIADNPDTGNHMLEGWPVGVVEALKYVAKRGILLAIISKNDEEHIRSVWDDIFRQRLSLSDFCAVRINWRAKTENMAEILQAINLLPRNVLFVDDNPAERARMQAVFPDMRALGGNPYIIRRVLLQSPELQPAALTAESAQRTAMVQSQLRREADRATLSLEEFASQQQVKLRLLRITETSHPRFPRALELINKTNQFNTTGRRWTEQECEGFFAAGGSMAAYEVEDRYTAYGLVGVVLLHGRSIVQWVMSCRVIGLGVEHAAMRELVAELRGTRAAPISATLTQTGLNMPCQNFFQDAGFTQTGTGWQLAADSQPRAAAHVEVV
jgi:FkbH-like protein